MDFNIVWLSNNLSGYISFFPYNKFKWAFKRDRNFLEIVKQKNKKQKLFFFTPKLVVGAIY